MEKRSRDWLIGYVTQKIPRAPRNERYLALFDQSLDETYLGLDLDWLKDGEQEGYFAREQTNIIGRLAFAWHTEGLSFYQDEKVANLLREAYLAVADHVTEDGQFVWPNDKDMYWAGSHEHAWRLEPLLLGAIWADDVFSESERETVGAALRRATDWLIANPCLQDNNRGVVWCAIATLGGLYYDDPKMLDAVTPHAEGILRGVILDDGEIGEHTEQYAGGGPCTNYTYTGLGYVYLYRLFSGDSSLDDLLLQGARWLSIYNTLTGYPLVAGASVRVAKPTPRLSDGLPFFEWASHSDSFFGRVADHHLTKIETEGGDTGMHIISPLIWSALARGVEASACPDWYTNWEALYERPNVAYTLVGRGYQTGVTFRARRGPYRNIPEEGVPLRGLQTFAFDEEIPILFHGRNITSTTRVGEIDTCRRDAVVSPVTKQGKMSIWVAQWDKLKTIYAFTPMSLVVLHTGVSEQIRTFWSLYETVPDHIALNRNERVVAFSGRQGRVYFLNGNAELYTHTEEGEQRWMLDVIVDQGVSVFAFSDASFEFGDVDGLCLKFADGSGTYQLNLVDFED